MSEKSYIEKVEELLLAIIDCRTTSTVVLSREQQELLELVKNNVEFRKIMQNIVINMLPVASTNINSVGYNKEHSILRLIFKNGGIYSYKGVPEDKYMEMVKSGNSVGKYFSSNIRNIFECVKNN